MTTDPFPKERAVEVTTARGTFRIGGICKGSGMIEPRMATMLGVLTCDAAVSPALLQRVLSEVTEHTFNAITVDGECSTNDCVALLANGASGVTIGEADLPLLSDALYEVCKFLSTEIVRGGEGATKLVTVQVTGARSYDEAKQAARAIANSLLVKTAIHGGDPNWGRLVAVAGRAGVGLRPPVRPRCASATSSCSRAAAPSTSARRKPPSTCSARTSASASTSAPAAPTKPRCGPAT